MEDRLALRPSEAARLLGIGRNATLDLCRRGVLPSLRVGRRILIPRRALEEWLAEAAMQHAEIAGQAAVR